ncbi:MAG: nucleoside 2-deoxyribosyltransferase [Candidatus Ranarchaeia archaeon]
MNYTKAPTLWEEQGNPEEIIIYLPETNRTLTISTPTRPYQCYTAGPLFTTLHRKMIEDIAFIAAAKRVIPYIPHVQSKDTPIGPHRMEEVFQLDVKGVDTSDFLIMWADYGLEPDPGTVWEQARAYILNKPIIVLREEFRNICTRQQQGLRESEMNLMMEQSVDIVVKSLQDVEEAIEEVIQYLEEIR